MENIIRTTPRLNSETAKVRKLASAWRFSSTAIGHWRLRIVRAPLIGEVRRALGGDHTGSQTASYSFGSDESGNLGIVIVVRHDLSLLAG
jgi:hypothetical protein